MSISDPESASRDKAPRQWPDYRAVWRWHFYAGLLTLPFVVILSISGAIYLFKPQIDAWNDRAYDDLEISTPASVTDQVRAALASFPDSVPTGYELPQTSRSAARVIVRMNDDAIRVYVHPQSLAILHSISENDRFMRIVHRLHGELLMEDWGSHLVELAASWTIIMIVTGLYLWWPRQSTSWGGIVYPRLRMGSRIFWKDIHSVIGVWISTLALFLLLTGLPWAKFWGEYFKTIRRMTGTAVVQQDWATGSERPAGGKPPEGGEHAGHVGHGGGVRRGGNTTMPKDLTAFDRVVATVRPLGLDHPVVVAPPSRGSEEWSAKSTTPNRPRRVDLKINGITGEIISREDFGDRHLIDRIVSTGVAAHEGQLFGWPNQLLGLATAMGLVLLSVSGVVMWWRRRDQGVLGAPRVLLSPRISFGLITLVVLLGIYLPLFGASLLLVLLLEWTVLRRIPAVSRWLGLTVG